MSSDLPVASRPRSAQVAWFATAGHLFSHGLLFVGLAVLLANVVPHFKVIFEDFKMPMPSMALAVIAFSDWSIEYWFVSAPLLGLTFAADAAVLVGLRHRLGSPRLGTLWSVLVLFVLGGLACLSAAALLQPYLALIDSLG